MAKKKAVASSVLPALTDHFPRHAVAPHSKPGGHEMLKAQLALVTKYFELVGIPGVPEVLPSGGRGGVVDMGAWKKGELRARLVGLVRGKRDHLYFELGFFVPERRVAVSTIVTDFWCTSDEHEPIVRIPDASVAKMERLEGRPIELAKPPATPSVRFERFAVGTVAELGKRVPAAIGKRHGERVVFYTTPKLDEVIDLLTAVPEGDFPDKDINPIMEAVEAITTEGDRPNAIDHLIGSKMVSKTTIDSVSFGFHASATLDEVVRHVASLGVEIVALPREATT